MLQEYRSNFDPKRRVIKGDGSNLRPKVTIKEKHLPLKLAELDEHSRIQDAVQEREGVSLRESFNLALFENPVWKQIDKGRWKT